MLFSFFWDSLQLVRCDELVDHKSDPSLLLVALFFLNDKKKEKGRAHEGIEY